MERIKLQHILIAFTVVMVVIIFGIAISQSVKKNNVKYVLSDEFIETVSAKTLEEMEKNLQNGTNNTILREILSSEIASEEFNKILADIVGKEYVKEVSDKVLEYITDKVVEQNNNEVVRPDVNKEITEEITEIIKNEVGDKNVNDITQEDLDKIYLIR